MRILIIVGILILAQVSFGADKSPATNIDKQYKSCLSTANSNMAMKLCANEAFVAADKVLNSVYKKIVTNLKTPTSDQYNNDQNKESLKRLITAEKAWITFRDANCDLQAAQDLGGTMETLTILDCSYTTTKSRVDELLKLNL